MHRVKTIFKLATLFVDTSWIYSFIAVCSLASFYIYSLFLHHLLLEVFLSKRNIVSRPTWWETGLSLFTECLVASIVLNVLPPYRTRCKGSISGHLQDENEIPPNLTALETLLTGIVSYDRDKNTSTWSKGFNDRNTTWWGICSVRGFLLTGDGFHSFLLGVLSVYCDFYSLKAFYFLQILIFNFLTVSLNHPAYGEYNWIVSMTCQNRSTILTFTIIYIYMCVCMRRALKTGCQSKPAVNTANFPTS